MDPGDVTYGWIRNTLALDRLAVSANVRPLIEGQSHVEIEMRST